jgi:hypothetical protein
MIILAKGKPCMKQKNLFFLLFPLISLACAALVPANPDADRPLATVFDNLVCEPPCWNHVVPGITTEEQAREAMQRLAGKPSDVYESKYPSGRVYMSYRAGNGYGERITFAVWNDVVKHIRFEGAGRYLSLSYVLGRFGNPDYAFQSMYGDSGPMLVLLYPSRGIQVLCLPRPAFIIGTIHCNPESRTIVEFFAPTEYDEHLAYFFEGGAPDRFSERAEYAQQFFCPWVGIEASYLLPNWGPFNYPEEYPTVPPAEIQSRCPRGE